MNILAAKDSRPLKRRISKAVLDIKYPGRPTSDLFRILFKQNKLKKCVRVGGG